jgi:hypothetical protein
MLKYIVPPLRLRSQVHCREVMVERSVLSRTFKIIHSVYCGAAKDAC